MSQRQPAMLANTMRMTIQATISFTAAFLAVGGRGLRDLARIGIERNSGQRLEFLLAPVAERPGDDAEKHQQQHERRAAAHQADHGAPLAAPAAAPAGAAAGASPAGGTSP